MQSIQSECWLNIPNVMTLARILLLPLVVWRYQAGDLSGALVLYLTAMLTDVLDGMIARKTNQVTSLGKLLDPVADKLSLMTLLILFAKSGQIPMWLLSLILIKECALILGSLAALRLGIVVSALPIGKLTTLIFVFSTISRFLALRQLADILLWLSVLFSFAAFVWYAMVLVKRLQKQRVIP